MASVTVLGPVAAIAFPERGKHSKVATIQGKDRLDTVFGGARVSPGILSSPAARSRTRRDGWMPRSLRGPDEGPHRSAQKCVYPAYV
jgi:hypothetical protein